MEDTEVVELRLEKEVYDILKADGDEHNMTVEEVILHLLTIVAESKTMPSQIK